MKRMAKEVVERRQKRKEEKEKKRQERAEARRVQRDTGGSSPAGSESSTESAGLVSPDSEDLGYLLGDEFVEERGEEVVQPSPKRARTGAGPSDVAGSSRSGRQGWQYWLGMESGSGEGQTQTSPATPQASAPRQSESDTRRFTRRRTVAR
jgi:hypothetical protein